MHFSECILVVKQHMTVFHSLVRSMSRHINLRVMWILKCCKWFLQKQHSTVLLSVFQATIWNIKKINAQYCWVTMLFTQEERYDEFIRFSLLPEYFPLLQSSLYSKQCFISSMGNSTAYTHSG